MLADDGVEKGLVDRNEGPEDGDDLYRVRITEDRRGVAHFVHVLVCIPYEHKELHDDAQNYSQTVLAILVRPGGQSISILLEGEKVPHLRRHRDHRRGHSAQRSVKGLPSGEEEDAYEDVEASGEGIQLRRLEVAC